MLRMAIEFDRLHTTMLSGLFGKRWTLLTWMSPPAALLPRDLNVLRHSVVLVFQILTVPSEEALGKNRVT